MITKVTEGLIQKSAITGVQLDTLLLQQRVNKREMRVADARKLRKPEGVTVGSYYRVLDQARDNLERAIFTLLLGAKLHVIQTDGVVRLLNMVSAAPDEMPEEDLDQFMRVVTELVRRILVI